MPELLGKDVPKRDPSGAVRKMASLCLFADEYDYKKMIDVIAKAVREYLVVDDPTRDGHTTTSNTTRDTGIWRRSLFALPDLAGQIHYTGRWVSNYSTPTILFCSGHLSVREGCA